MIIRIACQEIEHQDIPERHLIPDRIRGDLPEQGEHSAQIVSVLCFIFQYRGNAKRLREIFLMQPQRDLQAVYGRRLLGRLRDKGPVETPRR